MDQSLENNLTELSQKLGYEFADPSLLAAALRHSSYAHEHFNSEPDSNERLEFLGDAVLELTITEMLFNRFPEDSEGRLSKARSSMVNESRLARTALDLGLGDYLLLGKGEENQGGREKPSILADAVEAVLAAVYLDGGLEAAAEVVGRLLGDAAENGLEAAPQQDFKTRLQELVQEKLHLTPRYELLEADGPDHDKTFHMTLFIEDKPLAQGSGKSKKEAQQDAARNVLELWKSGQPPF